MSARGEGKEKIDPEKTPAGGVTPEFPLCYSKKASEKRQGSSSIGKSSLQIIKWEEGLNAIFNV